MQNGGIQMILGNRKGVKVIENPNTREPLQEGEKYFKEKICSSYIFDEWTLYEQPIINSMHPDFILTHPEKGVLIVEVKDWHLRPPTYSNDGMVLGSNGKYINKNPISQVRAYKDMILKYELDEFLNANEKYSSFSAAMVMTITYFHVALRDRALEFCGNPNHKYYLVWTKSELDYLCDTPSSKRNDYVYPKFLFYERSNFAKDGEQTLQKLVKNLEKVLRPSDYARGRQQAIPLTPEQKRLVTLRRGSIRRWSGVAGSGKTLILATKATEAIKSGQRVLVLTYNITLRHYIRDLCSQQHGHENRKLLKTNLTIVHYHGFLKILLAELKLSAPKDDFGNYAVNAMNEISEEIKGNFPRHLNYDSILIDEGQDFNGEWIHFLKQFYTKRGELLVFYDQAQDLYKQSLWVTDSNLIEGIGFKGQPGHLKISHRLPQSIVSQIDLIRKLLNIDNHEKIVTASTQQDLFTQIKWVNIPAEMNRAQLADQYIRSILCEGNSTVEDITVITMKEDSGIELVNYFEGSHIVKTSHVFDLSGQKGYNLRRNEKWRFQPGKGRLKICSYHSYKGWESSHIILLLEGIGDELKRKEELQNALFIAITRINAFSDSRSFLCINNCEEFNWLAPHFNGE